MMKFLIPPKIIWVICVAFMLVFILIFNPLLVKMFFGKNQFNSGVNDENVMAQLVYTWNGYEIIISGNGNMSDYIPVEWAEYMMDSSSGWKVSIKSVRIHKGVSSISSGLFSGCSKLSTVYLPRSMEHIGAKAFAYCFSLNKIEYQGTVDEWRLIMNDSPLWSSESSIDSVVCTDGVFYLSS